MSWSMPLTDILVTEDDISEVLDCLRSGWLTMGPRVQEFERRFAEYAGVEHAVTVSSGTAALHLAAVAAGIAEGDEVIVPNLTFVASATAARYCGATSVLCDVNGPHDLNLDLEDVRRRITPRTRAVVAVHFMGYPAEIDELRALCDEHGLALIEDACQAIGARSPSGAMVGTVGDLGCFSFFSKKQLCVGEGGMVVTGDAELAARIRLLRSHAMTSVTWDRHQGYAESYDVVDIGYNFRMDEPRAALGASRLARLDADLEVRRSLVRRYREALSDQAGIALVWSDEQVSRSTHFAFPILLDDGDARDWLRAQLASIGIQTTAYPAISTLTDYADQPAEGLSRSIELADRHCALPLSSLMTEADVDRVVGAVVSTLQDRPADTSSNVVAAD